MNKWLHSVLFLGLVAIIGVGVYVTKARASSPKVDVNAQEHQREEENHESCTAMWIERCW